VQSEFTQSGSLIAAGQFYGFDSLSYECMSGCSGGALWDCVLRVCGGGGGCAGGGVPLEAVPALSWCGEVSLGGKYIIKLRYVRVSAAGDQQHSTYHAPKVAVSTK